MTALLLLAAGASTRMGRPKQLLRFHGQSLLERAVETALATSCRPVVIVLGAYASEIRQEIRGNEQFHCVVNEAWQEGMGASIRRGMEEILRLAPPVDSVLFMLVDQPFVDPSLLEALVATYQQTGAPVVASEYQPGLFGVPAVFGKPLFGELQQVQGDKGARVLFQKYAEQLQSVPFSRGILDLDTPEEWDRFLEEQE